MRLLGYSEPCKLDGTRNYAVRPSATESDAERRWFSKFLVPEIVQDAGKVP